MEVTTLHICTFSWFMILHYIFLVLLNYLDISLEIDSKDWLRAQLHDKRDDLNFTIVNFPFICGNISFSWFMLLNR